MGVESYVNASFKFEVGTVILPNQTLLLISGRSNANDVPRNRVYNLYQYHRTVLGLANRRSVLLSREGFYLKLTDTDDSVVDIAANLILDGLRRNKAWDLPETDGEARRSIVRKGTDGTDKASWVVTDSTSTYYGHRKDVGSPGDRLG